MLSITLSQVLFFFFVAFAIIGIAGGIFIYLLTKEESRQIKKRKIEDDNSLVNSEWNKFENQN